MTREQFAEGVCEQGWIENPTEILDGFDATRMTTGNVVWGATYVFGLNDDEVTELYWAAYRDAEKRMEQWRQRNQ